MAVKFKTIVNNSDYGKKINVIKRHCLCKSYYDDNEQNNN